MRPFSFVHLADIHLGCMQYNLIERREDFSRVFIEAVDKIIGLKPSFAIFSGDIFDSPRPSNQTLATAIRELRKIRDAGIKVFAVDGSHDLEPNITTGTILIPLHNAGLINYLPRLDGGCWENEDFYIYGLQSSRSLREADEKLPKHLEEKTPKPKPNQYNILVFHGALDNPEYTPPNIKPDIRVSHLTGRFNYYAGGHVHEPKILKFKDGILVYPGCLETTVYTEAEIPKGFYHVKVESLDNPPSIERIKIESARKFIVEEKVFNNLPPEKILEESSSLLSNIDTEGVVLILVLKGTLPVGVRKSQLDIPKIRSSTKKAIYTVIINQMSEPEWLKQTLTIKESKELKTMAYEYLSKIFAGQFPEKLSGKLARMAMELLDPLLSGDEEKVKFLLEEAVKNDY